MASTTANTGASRGAFDATQANGEYNQYWYSQNTINALMREVAHHATACAFLSTPSLFFALDQRRGDEDAAEDARLHALRQHSRLFEYDEQWSADPCFVKYDFYAPEQVPIQYMAAFDYVVADPPFITAEVWASYIATTRLLLKEGGKLLFTTVLENHTMLEGGMDRPLFIAGFMPRVEHLTYQYVCFLSYEPTVLSQPNAEVTDLEPSTLAAIRMANDLRSSEKEFAAQMAQRKRDGEARLPTTAYERDLQLASDPAARQRAEEAQKKGVDWDSIPIEKMEWGHIPEGLTMYPDGNVPPAEGNTDAATGGAAGGAGVSYGPVYDACVQLRTDLDTFKSHIDVMQRHMDGQMKLRRQRVKLTKDLPTAGADTAAVEQQIKDVSAAITASEEERSAKLDAMAQLAHDVQQQEEALATLQQQPFSEVPYAAAMSDCIAAYRTVEAKKAPLQELAADATGRYKFPIFARMKELLQRMKELKQV